MVPGPPCTAGLLRLRQRGWLQFTGALCRQATQLIQHILEQLIVGARLSRPALLMCTGVWQAEVQALVGFAVQAQPRCPAPDFALIKCQRCGFGCVIANMGSTMP
jgi:hypothetical protein